ncbi:HAD-like domain-containing protein [Cyathus striatus]|nr:HAD-like domain-containing protein [Cyathus striatus]
MAEPKPRLTDHKAIIFDVYGTLCDWETGLYNGLKPLLSRYPASRSWTRKDALTAFGSVETDLQGQYPDMLYSNLLAKAHEVLEQRLRRCQDKKLPSRRFLAPLMHQYRCIYVGGRCLFCRCVRFARYDETEYENEHQAFGNSIKDWMVFPDSHEALHRLAKHFKLTVLSNVDHESFRFTHALLSEGVLSSPDISLYSYPANNPNKYWLPQETPGSKSPFSLVLTAQDTHCYKPDVGGFKIALEYIGQHASLLGGSEADVKEKTLSVAQSLSHDHEPAHRLGLRSVWIDRQGAVTCNENPGGPRAEKKWTWRFETLADMADAVEKELAIGNN